MDKPFTITFTVDTKLLALLFICWKYKFPISYFLTFYEMYGAQSLFILKALACTKRITLNDNAFANIIEESKKLHQQILKGISTNIKINQLEAQLKLGKLIDEDIPEKPELNLEVFSEDYRTFITSYLSKNVADLFTQNYILEVNSRDLYDEIK